jgi:glucose/arabinose dehydrogenase
MRHRHRTAAKARAADARGWSLRALLVSGAAAALLVYGASVAIAEEVPPSLPACEAAERFDIETVAEMPTPWGIGFLPGGDLLVASLDGTLRRVGTDGEVTEIGGVPPVFYAGQAGLFEVQPAPDFPDSGKVYLVYAHGDFDENATRLATATLDGDRLSDLEVLFTAEFLKEGSFHYGGRLVFLPDDTLLLAIGEGSEFREEAQVLSNHLGTIVRLGLDGSVPGDNPFVGRDDAKPEIWSYGHRNPQGLARDPETGIVYDNEHGPRGGDEINVIEKGKNYGWPAISYGIDYSGAMITPHTALPGMEQPIKQWTPSMAPSGLTVYRGDAFPGWDGDLFSGALAFRYLSRVAMEDGSPVCEEKLLADFKDNGRRIRDLKTGPDGLIYVAYEGRDAGVVRLVPAAE